MATATLTFDLTDSDDRMEHLRCTRALDMALVLWELQYNLKKRAESEFDMRSEKGEDISYQDVIDFIFEQIRGEMEEQNIVIDNLII